MHGSKVVRAVWAMCESHGDVVVTGGESSRVEYDWFKEAVTADGNVDSVGQEKQ